SIVSAVLRDREACICRAVWVKPNGELTESDERREHLWNKEAEMGRGNGGKLKNRIG
ncbi:hypothetical protein GOODEAATRI_001688, partial [Goodea atripinnis]